MSDSLSSHRECSKWMRKWTEVTRVMKGEIFLAGNWGKLNRVFFFTRSRCFLLCSSPMNKYLTILMLYRHNIDLLLPWPPRYVISDIILLR
jgi:hypothetical protein